MLPQEFLERMEQMLGEEYPAFLASYEKNEQKALRLNPVKGDAGQLKEMLPFSLRPVPWEKNGFCYGQEGTPGKHPYHEAGLYYIQEPSAMAPVSFLMADVYEEKAEGEHRYSERILDLCAAPGGKTTQIAGAMQEAYQKGRWPDRGILISNEIHPARAKILSENVERMGIANAVVTNETPQHLAEIFEGYFTRILVDAPCSGEGMFRKHPEACDEWSGENVKLCAERQAEILDCAASMLAPGGRLVYSTCTFAPAENEGSAADFLARHPEFSVKEVTMAPGMVSGVPEWAYFGAEKREGNPPERSEERLEALKKTIRLYPHKVCGEGHYLAVFQKEGSIPEGFSGYCKNGVEKGENTADKDGAKEKNRKEKGFPEFFSFAEESLSEELLRVYEREGMYLRFGEQLYLAPKGMPGIQGLKVLRPGLHLGTIKKNRFEPSHALALSLKPNEAMHRKDFPAESGCIKDYLGGGTFPAEGEKGWYLITADGYSIGWGKLAGGVMKNHYPKGLRRLY